MLHCALRPEPSHSKDPRLGKSVQEGESTAQVRIGNSRHYPFLTSERLEKAGVDIRTFDLA